MNMMYVQCEWITYDHEEYYTHSKPCTAQALNILVMGCLNQHIREFIVCGMHTDDWEDIGEEHKAYCMQDGCGQHIETWEKVKVAKATQQWLTTHHT